MAAGQSIPFKAYSEGTKAPILGWRSYNKNAVPLAVIAKKAYFATPADELPNNTVGSVWKQHLGQITYFTPARVLAPAYICVYLKFEDNFVGQQVKIILNNSAGAEPIVMQDWTSVSYNNGTFLPIFQTCQLANLSPNVSYWVEVLFEKTVNKAPGFYGADGIEGFLSKYWWSISPAPVADEFLDDVATDVDNNNNVNILG